MSSQHSGPVLPLKWSPEPFNELIRSLCVKCGIAFEDIPTLDDPDLPRPAFAVVLAIPTNPSYKARKKRSRVLGADLGIQTAYMKVATNGAPAVPVGLENEVAYHSICLVRSIKDEFLYKLDGVSKGPFRLGKVDLGKGGDILTQKTVFLIKRYISRDQGRNAPRLMGTCEPWGKG
ncbi:hypothetical protein N657DRAFT_634337 [Parathielavia appendiculata]|uniref:ubiquitinyl hydrolase 1 n=1 Tax=Parathielavia appendiculata TaxID=2587402 RepID=A0AAN6TYP3_9PEZI|nr:hypothetical protein N657DRAFT_634337 [Parathielavia appendiculata]